MLPGMRTGRPCGVAEGCGRTTCMSSISRAESPVNRSYFHVERDVVRCVRGQPCRDADRIRVTAEAALDAQPIARASS
jgi:hypothetical protein